MQVICPKCGMQGESTGNCLQCQESLQWVGICYYQSQKYYKKGYEEAEKRQLTQAIPYLQKAVSLNKYNREAKNLLGLIHFELGQVGEALKMWILSIAVCKEDNIANDYMETVRKHPKKLEMYKETVQLYNRALKYLAKKNDDMAVIRLKKAISINPKFVDARNLLTLCYIYENQYGKARDQIIKVLEIDRNNEKALHYLKYIEIQDESIEKQEPSIISGPHLNELEVDNTIKPYKVLHKGGTLGRYVFYFIFGFVCMYAIQTALIMPAKTKDLESKLYTAINENSDMKLQLDTFTKDSEDTLMTIEKDKQELTKENEALQIEKNKLLQENRLLKIEQYKEAGDWIQAAEILYTISPDTLSEENKAVYEAYKKLIYPKATDKLYEQGYSAYKQKDFIEASAKFEQAMMYGSSPKLMSNMLYYIGEMEEESKNITKAIQHYQAVVKDYAGTAAEKKASNRLKQLNPQD